MYLLLLSMSAHLTRELGMAPGGEFRRACREVSGFPCNFLITLLSVYLQLIVSDTYVKLSSGSENTRL